MENSTGTFHRDCVLMSFCECRRHLYMENSTGTFHRDCVLMSFCECRRHYSSWGVSRESQSSPLRFFVESNATDHQEVSSIFSDKNPKNPSLVDFERATWSLEVVSPANRLPWPIYFIIIICIIYSYPQCWIRQIGHPQPLESLDRL